MGLAETEYQFKEGQMGIDGEERKGRSLDRGERPVVREPGAEIPRRRLVKAGLYAAPVILTLRSRSAWGQDANAGSSVSGASGQTNGDNTGQGIPDFALDPPPPWTEEPPPSWADD